jgi:hypothetical protein
VERIVQGLDIRTEPRQSLSEKEAKVSNYGLRAPVRAFVLV